MNCGIIQSNFDKSLTALPFGLGKGTVYSSCMPGYNDAEPNVKADLKLAKLLGITHIALIGMHYEWEGIAGNDLPKRYQQMGFKVRHLQLRDGVLPHPERFTKFIEILLKDVAGGGKLLIHCKEGRGRTGLTAACIAKVVFRASADQAAKWVRHYIPGAVESREELGFVGEFALLDMKLKPSGFQESLTFLPLGFPNGKIYRSKMPCYNDNSNLDHSLETLKISQITRVVLLTPFWEYEAITGKDLKKEYEQAGIKVSHLPIIDGKTPDMQKLHKTLTQIFHEVANGGNVVMHCLGGNGRTGLLAACLAKQQFGMSGADAIDWVRQYVPSAVETCEQVNFIHKFASIPTTAFQRSIKKLPYPMKGSISTCISPIANEYDRAFSKNLQVIADLEFSEVACFISPKEEGDEVGKKLFKGYNEKGIVCKSYGGLEEQTKMGLAEKLESLLKRAQNGEHILMHTFGTKRNLLKILVSMTALAFECTPELAAGWLGQQHYSLASSSGSEACGSG